jgi:plasmid stabilization system protein ParE
LKIRLLHPARRELTEAVNYYNAHRARLGDEFRDEVWATLARIKKLPESWHALSDSIRRCPTNRFPYGIIYTVAGPDILIIAVAHNRQAPEYLAVPGRTKLEDVLGPISPVTSPSRTLRDT